MKVIAIAATLGVAVVLIGSIRVEPSPPSPERELQTLCEYAAMGAQTSDADKKICRERFHAITGR